MNFLKLIQLLSFVAISFFSVDVYSVRGGESKSESDEYNATVYPAGHNVTLTTVTTQSNQKVTITREQRFNCQVVKHNGELYSLGKKITGEEKKTCTRSKEVYCCGCDYNDSLGVGSSAAWMTGKCCLAILIECQDSMQCCCRRTIEYEVEMQR